MFMAPASPRAGTKRMRLCRAIASRIGMLWIEITPISANACAMRSPTGSVIDAASGERAAIVMLLSSDMPRGAARYLELGAGDEARGRRAEKGDGARDLVGLAQSFQGDVPGARDVRVPLLPRLRGILARHEAALPLAGVDQAEHHR